jgi:hypothetical protein
MPAEGRKGADRKQRQWLYWINPENFFRLFANPICVILRALRTLNLRLAPTARNHRTGTILESLSFGLPVNQPPYSTK